MWNQADENAKPTKRPPPPTLNFNRQTNSKIHLGQSHVVALFIANATSYVAYTLCKAVSTYTTCGDVSSNVMERNHRDIWFPAKKTSHTVLEAYPYLDIVCRVIDAELHQTRFLTPPLPVEPIGIRKPCINLVRLKICVM
jgi:hypothetical protein